MLTYDYAARYPSAFPSLFGVKFADFESLFADYLRAHAARFGQSATTKRGTPRRRKPGGGDKPKLDDRTQLLLTLFWLKVYPTYEVLGFFFGLHKTNARHTALAVLAVLETLDDFPFDRPPRDRRPVGSAAAVMDAFPSIRLVIDAKDQRTRRPTGYDNQKPYYSGKKKAHTLKTQIAVDPSGVIESVSPTFPGSVHDLTVLRTTGLIDRLNPDQGGMLDKGYDGLARDHPDRTLILPFKARRNRPLTDDEKATNRHRSTYRIVVEHANAQLNRFGALAHVYRQARTGHGRVVRAVATLVNRRTRQTPLKTYPVAA